MRWEIPGFFSQINAYLDHDTLISDPGIYEKIRVMLQHIRALCDYKGESHGMREARKHVGWYLKGMRGAAGFRREAGTLETFSQLILLTQRMIQENQVN